MADSDAGLFPNIMLIDDEELTQTLIAHMLKEIHCGDIMVFGGSERALQKLQKNQGYFDLVISDWEMPGMNGLDFLRAFRQFDKTTPVLMVTGNTSRELVVEAIKAGVNDFLGKPFTAKDLLAKVKKLVKQKAAADLSKGFDE
ncbi:response regulator [Paraneptunicella aestuarii]|uniref:response regulator n=1 Tax=Paraneptunicella aestuarii TaxID=2831148 RepID=UPI001E45A655|nr:response regulator [Paraneptunicella aestuarii]UAA38692.1 response regulator [Paraneptunicella aestuarii]